MTYRSEPGVPFGEAPPKEVQDALKLLQQGLERSRIDWDAVPRYFATVDGLFPLGEPATQPAEGETAL